MTLRASRYRAFSRRWAFCPSWDVAQSLHRHYEKETVVRRQETPIQSFKAFPIGLTSTPLFPRTDPRTDGLRVLN